MPSTFPLKLCFLFSSWESKLFEAGTTFPYYLHADLRKWRYNPALGFMDPAGVLISFLTEWHVQYRLYHPARKSWASGKDQSLAADQEAYTKEYHSLSFLLVVLVCCILTTGSFTPGATLSSNNPAMRLFAVAGISLQQAISKSQSYGNSLQIHGSGTV